MVAKKTSKQWWVQGRRDAALTAFAAIIAAYLVASRAIDTGSLGQYGIVLLLLILFVNRLVQFFVKRK